MIKKTRKLSHDEKIVEKRKQLAEKGKVAAIWTRVSSADQYKQNYSIDTQKAACREYCERNNIRIKDTSEAKTNLRSLPEKNSWI